MRIGVDASCWANQRGYGRYTRELLNALLSLDRRNEYLLFIDKASALLADDLPAGVEQVRVETSKPATQAASAAGRRSLRDLWAMRQAVYQHGRDLDLFYFPSVYTFFPPRTSAKVIVTIHDTTAERYPRLIFPNWRSRLLWKLKVQLAVRRADLIATVSEASKRAIMKEFRVPEARVRIIFDAVGSEFYPIRRDPRTREVIARYGVNAEEPFILYVGGISPHKNLETLVEAHALLLGQPDIPRVNLVLVGDYQKDVFYSSYTSLQA
jgi:glycosyltransferase involved in cell wall biosynthesis